MRLAILALLVITEVLCDNDDLKVKIKNGWIEGKTMTTLKGREIDGFLGIPFAKPPIAQLRFKAPQAPDNWDGIKSATKVHDACPQRNIYIHSEKIWGNEDCLYLNVYRPKNIKNKLLPVMVFFHGGGWLACSGNTDDYGPDMLLDRDVVLVVTNYRLGALGFLSTEDLEVPGNNGMKDQSFALKWTHENIERFGGDPNSVTIFGESAGGASVHYHILSPLSKGYFHRGIAESGTALCPWAFGDKGFALSNAKKLATALKCPTKTSKAMIDCLRTIDAYDIVSQDIHFHKYDYDPMIPFRPVAEIPHDGAFIDDQPENLMKSGRMQDVPIMNGLTKDDGALKTASLLNDQNMLADLENDFADYVATSLQFYHAKNFREIARKIKDFYFNNAETFDHSIMKNLTNLWTDGWFLQGIDKLNVLHKKYSNSPIYYYLFAYRGTASFTEIFGDKVNDYGVCHADELQYLFPVGQLLFPDKPLSHKDIKMVELLTELWVNFATYGNPTPAISNSRGIHWEPLKSADDLNYLHIGHESEYEMRDGLFKERTLFWRELNQDMNRVNTFRDEL